VITRTAVGAPGAGPYAVAVDASGVAWITLVHAGQVAGLPRGGEATLHDLGNPACRPSLLAVGPDGAVWVTRGGDDRIDRIDPDGARRSFPVTGGPYGIAAGPDGTVWFTAIGADAVGRLAPDGQATLTPVPEAGGMPAMITAGPDGAMWFTLNRAAALGRVDATGEITLHPLPDPACGPVGIAADGEALWFAEIGAGRVGRLVPGEPPQEFDLPDRAARPHAVAPDGAGGCWVTLWAAGALAHLDAHGTVTAVHDLGEGTEPHGVAVAADGAVLVALETGHVVTLAEIFRTIPLGLMVEDA
jgi:virginiamycin B lyase